jgi:hypothetical protein
MGSDITGNDLQEAASIVWDTLDALDLPELDGLPAWKASRALGPVKCGRLSMQLNLVSTAAAIRLARL